MAKTLNRKEINVDYLRLTGKINTAKRLQWLEASQDFTARFTPRSVLRRAFKARLRRALIAQ